jgi:hypothetical protein
MAYTLVAIVYTQGYSCGLDRLCGKTNTEDRQNRSMVRLTMRRLLG